MPTGIPCTDPTHERYAPPSHGCATCTRVRVAEKRAEYRRLVFDHYSAVCTCCSLATPELLTIDHINPSTKVKGRRGHAVYLDLVKAGYPEGYQVLCYSCNSGKHGHRGVCPHQQEPDPTRMSVWRQSVKRQVLESYGGAVCVCCRESSIYVLTLHHTNSNGAEHRTLLSGRSEAGSNFYADLKRAGCPTDVPLEVRCFNCNVGADLPGGCPCK